MASKVFTIIYDAELGKSVALPYSGSCSAKSNDGAVGRGYGKKRMAARCDKKIHNKLPMSYPFRLG